MPAGACKMGGMCVGDARHTDTGAHAGCREASLGWRMELSRVVHYLLSVSSAAAALTTAEPKMSVEMKRDP